MLKRARWAGCLALVLAVGWTVEWTGPVTAAPADEPAADTAAPCVIDGPAAGVWQEIGQEIGQEIDGTRAIRFDDRQYSVVKGGTLSQIAPVVTCQAGHVEICSFGRLQAMDLAVDGDRLDVHDLSQDQHRTFRRLGTATGTATGTAPDKMRAAFDLEPFEIPDAGSQPLTKDQIESIRQELIDRRERDQEFRKPPYDWAKINRIDRDNTSYLEQLVRRVGWIDSDRFGHQAADGAFLIVQHSGDLPLMLGALPHLKAHGLPQDYALLYDRTQLSQGLPQRYGSQLNKGSDGTMGLQPIETLEGIDTLRAEMGLEPLDAYLARFGLHERRILHCP